MVDKLCDECREHFAAVRTGLAALDIAFELEPRLVRGLDYYTRTTFEFQAPALETAQNGVGGGGRYDALTEQLGGPPTPGIGFGLGIERVLLACDAEGTFPAPSGSGDVVDGAHDLRAEYVLRITGTVRRRPDGTVNPNLLTGEIEVHDCSVEVLNTAEPPPFPVTDRTEADETIRLRHRYVDLRRDRMQRNLRLRAVVNSAIRRSFEEQGFVEVETPLLMVSTPEGSRDFVVPSRLKQGSFYALPQSPQLFKQLLMVGGADRYFQIARLARDEDLRADRQLEFTQLDAEASFVDQDDVIAFISEAVAAANEAATGERPAAMPSITWEEAAERYGSDKPDVRFGMELVELTHIFAGTEAKAFQAPSIQRILVDGPAASPCN